MKVPLTNVEIKELREILRERAQPKEHRNPPGSREDLLDSLQDLVDECLDPKLSREEVIGKIKEMNELLEPFNKDLS